MDPVIVGALAGGTAILSVAFWQLLVRPEPFLALWTRALWTRGRLDPEGGGSDGGWFEQHPAALDALRWALAGLLFVSGFLTGLALTFLTGTA
jgi:hypothetical protein